MVSGSLVLTFKEFFFSPKGLILGSAFLFLVQSQLVEPIQMKPSDYLPPPVIIQNLAAGLKIQLADSYWLRALQDFDYCDQPVNAHECHGESWLYQVLDLVTDLDHQFKEAYHIGALALTIIISDYAGASQLFDKGVAEFPTDWKLNYAAGYHAYYEEKNYLKAAKLYYAAAENGAPAWVKPMAAKIAADGGDEKYATQILEQMIKNSEDPELIKRLQMKLAQIKTN